MSGIKMDTITSVAYSDRFELRESGIPMNTGTNAGKIESLDQMSRLMGIVKNAPEHEDNRPRVQEVKRDVLMGKYQLNLDMLVNQLVQELAISGG